MQKKAVQPDKKAVHPEKMAVHPGKRLCIQPSGEPFSNSHDTKFIV